MLENKTLNAPHIHVLGPLSVKTVQDAHTLLEDHRVKGKLIMTV